MKKVRISEERRRKLQINEEKPEEVVKVQQEINSRNIKQILPKTIGTDGSLRSSHNFPPQTITSSHMDMAQNSLMKKNHPRDDYQEIQQNSLVPQISSNLNVQTITFAEQDHNQNIVRTGSKNSITQQALRANGQIANMD